MQEFKNRLKEIENEIVETYESANDPYFLVTADIYSTVLLYLTQKSFDDDLNCIFLNSGFEYEEVLEFLYFISVNWNLNIKCFFYDVDLESEVFGNKIACAQRAICKVKPDCLFLGDDGYLFTAINELEKNSGVENLEISAPLSNCDENFLWYLILKNDLPYCQLYDNGYKKISSARRYEEDSGARKE